jgi:hypothetical protein
VSLPSTEVFFQFCSRAVISKIEGVKLCSYNLSAYIFLPQDNFKETHEVHISGA